MKSQSGICNDTWANKRKEQYFMFVCVRIFFIYWTKIDRGEKNTYLLRR